MIGLHCPGQGRGELVVDLLLLLRGGALPGLLSPMQRSLPPPHPTPTPTMPSSAVPAGDHERLQEPVGRHHQRHHLQTGVQYTTALLRCSRPGKMHCALCSTATPVKRKPAVWLQALIVGPACTNPRDSCSAARPSASRGPAPPLSYPTAPHPTPRPPLPLQPSLPPSTLGPPPPPTCPA